MKILSNERGVALVAELVLGAIVLVAAGYAVYAVSHHNKTASSGGSSPSKTAVDSSCVAQYHDATLCHFAGNSADFQKTAYTATLSIQQAGSAASTMTLKNDGKGNTALSGSSNGQQFNSIELAGSTYLEVSGTWIKYPSGASTSAPTNPTSSMDIALGSGITYNKLGTAPCGNLTCYEYQVSGAAAGGTQDVWFDTGSYKLREWREADSAGNTTDMTVTYQPVTISAPSPVENFSAAAG